MDLVPKSLRRFSLFIALVLGFTVFAAPQSKGQNTAAGMNHGPTGIHGQAGRLSNRNSIRVPISVEPENSYSRLAATVSKSPSINQNNTSLPNTDTGHGIRSIQSSGPRPQKSAKELLANWDGRSSSIQTRLPSPMQVQQPVAYRQNLKQGSSYQRTFSGRETGQRAAEQQAGPSGRMSLPLTNQPNPSSQRAPVTGSSNTNQPLIPTSTNANILVTPASHQQNLGTPASNPTQTDQPQSGQTPSGQLKRRDFLDRALPGLGKNPNSSESDKKSSTTGLQPLIQTGIGLAVVLPLALIFLFVMKKATPKSMLGLPVEAIEVLGNTALDSKHHLKLIRLGNKLVLLSVCDTNVQTVSEIHEPEEVSRLVALCQNKNKREVASTFQSILQQGEVDRSRGFLGSQQDQIPAVVVDQQQNRRHQNSSHLFEA